MTGVRNKSVGVRHSPNNNLACHLNHGTSTTSIFSVVTSSPADSATVTSPYLPTTLQKRVAVGTYIKSRISHWKHNGQLTAGLPLLDNCFQWVGDRGLVLIFLISFLNYADLSSDVCKVSDKVWDVNGGSTSRGRCYQSAQPRPFVRAVPPALHDTICRIIRSHQAGEYSGRGFELPPSILPRPRPRILLHHHRHHRLPWRNPPVFPIRKILVFGRPLEDGPCGCPLLPAFPLRLVHPDSRRPKLHKRDPTFEGVKATGIKRSGTCVLLGL